jgi:uncharacterized OB-fold protein
MEGRGMELKRSIDMDIARNWRLRKQRYALEGEQCDHCMQYIFPPRDICPHCGEEARGVHTMS